MPISLVDLVQLLGTALAVLKLNVQLRKTLNFPFSSLSFAADEVACLCGHALLRNRSSKDTENSESYNSAGEI